MARRTSRRDPYQLGDRQHGGILNETSEVRLGTCSLTGKEGRGVVITLKDRPGERLLCVASFFNLVSFKLGPEPEPQAMPRTNGAATWAATMRSASRSAWDDEYRARAGRVPGLYPCAAEQLHADYALATNDAELIACVRASTLEDARRVIAESKPSSADAAFVHAKATVLTIVSIHGRRP